MSHAGLTIYEAAMYTGIGVKAEARDEGTRCGALPASR
jgi:hypothetical protein